MKRKYLYLIIVLFFQYGLSAQIIDTIWTKSIGGPYADKAIGIIQSVDSGYFVAGHSYYPFYSEGGNYDFMMVKLNSVGDTIWTASGGTSSTEDIVTSVMPTYDSGFLFTGYEHDDWMGDYTGPRIVKYDAQGTESWSIFDYSWFDYFEPHASCQTYDSGYLIAGFQWDLTSGSYTDSYARKLDAGGNEIWRKTYNIEYGNSKFYSISQTNDSAFIVVGETHNDYSEGYDLWVLKLDLTGNTVWSKTYGGSGDDFGKSILQTADSGYILSGYSNSANGDVHGNHGGNDIWILKINLNGDTLWTRSFGGSGNEIPTSLNPTIDNGFILAGYSTSLDGDVSGNHGSNDYWIVKLNENGTIIWTRCLGGTGDDKATSIQQTADSGYIVSGYSSSTDGDVIGNHGSHDFWVVKLGKPNIEVYPEAPVLSAAAGSTDINIFSTIPWSIMESDPWLSVSPSSGTGDDILTVTTEQNDLGTPRIGYLHISSGDDSISVTITQRNAHFTPIWSFNPYQPMNIIVNEAKLDNNDLAPGGEIAVFQKQDNGSELCVGVGALANTITQSNPLIIIASADDPGTSALDGFVNGDSIYFKIWDDDQQFEVTNIEATFNELFDTDYNAFGTAIVVFDAIPPIYQTHSVMAGWNSMSFFNSPKNNNLIDMLQPLVGSSQLIKANDEQGGFIQYIPGYGWINTIGYMENTEGYFIKTSNDRQFIVLGEVVDLPFEVPLISGWNIMGYPLTQQQNAMDALQPLIDNDQLIKVIDESGGFIQEIPGVGWMNTIGSFDPGKGYYTKVSDNTSLLLDNPPARMLYNEPSISYPPSILFTQPFKNNPYQPMNILISDIAIDGISIHTGDEIAVFDNDLCVGTGVVNMKNDIIVNIIATMDDPTTKELDGYVPGENITFQYLTEGLPKPIILEASSVSGENLFDPLETYVCSLSAAATSITENKEHPFLMVCVPNPVSERATIRYNIKQEGVLRLEICDLTGRRIASIQNEFVTTGAHEVTFDAGDLKKGIYLIKAEQKTQNNRSLEVIKFIRP